MTAIGILNLEKLGGWNLKLEKSAANSFVRPFNRFWLFARHTVNKDKDDDNGSDSKKLFYLLPKNLLLLLIFSQLKDGPMFSSSSFW